MSNPSLNDRDWTQAMSPRPNFTWLWWLCALACTGAVCAWLLWSLLGDKVHHLEWPGGLKVQVLEQDNSDMDTVRYTYKFSQDGSDIAPPQEYNNSSPISHGSAQGTPYFFVRKCVGIYHPAGPNSSIWTTWNTDDQSLTSWMKRFVAARAHVRKQKDEYFEDPDYAVVNFKVQGKTWTVGLKDWYSLTTGNNDWDGGMPEYLHVESHDSGLTWKVKEPVSMPEWLIEVPKKRN